MPLIDLPVEFQQFVSTAVRVIRRVYEDNAERHDPAVGDDATTFGFILYRNSWFQLEQEVALLDSFTSARPSGSLVITGQGVRLHVYRFGNDASVNIDGFRLDEESQSVTKQMIARSNADQMALDFADAEESLPLSDPTLVEDLRDLVIVHAGNPDDGCCRIWLGAPVTADDTSSSGWAWQETVWMIEPGESAADLGPASPATPPHHTMPEPEIELRPVAESPAADDQEQ